MHRELGLSSYALKPRFQNVLRPLACSLARRGVTANQVTIAAAVMSVVVGVVVAAQLPDTRTFLLIPAWLFVRIALNAIDGMLAHEFAQQSRLGLYLNELGDSLSDIALYLPFALLAPLSAPLVVTVVILAVMSEYAGALAASVHVSRRNDGPMGKSDRAFVFGALGLWAGVSPPLPAWTDVLLVVIAAALVLTIVNRVRGGLRERP